MTTTHPPADTTILDHGSGTPLVLLHGTLMDARMFEPQLQGLSHAMRVIAYDLRARTSAGQSAHTMDDLIADFIGVIDAAGLEKVVVGGMSMGAFAALRIALRHPDRVTGLVLIGGQASAFSAADQEFWGERYASRQGAPVGPDFAAEDIAFNFEPSVDARIPGLRDTWLRVFSERDGTAMHHEVQAWIGLEDVRSQLSNLAMPALIIHGDHDTSVPVREAVDMFHGLPNSRLLVLPRTGHAANLERPEHVNAAILEFIEGI